MFIYDHLMHIFPIGIALYFVLSLITEKNRKPIQQTACYCPECDNELVSSGSFVSDEEVVVYQCSECGEISRWHFDTAPVPILIEK